MFTISGIVTFGTADNLAGTTLAGFSLPVAQYLFNTHGAYDTINVLARPGRGRRCRSARDPGSCRRVWRSSAAKPSPTSCQQPSTTASPFFSTALLVFALISLFVGGFTIFNTFSITVGQRPGAGTARVVGASRRQLFRSVLGEAALDRTGRLRWSVSDWGSSRHSGLERCLKAFSISLPSAPLVFEARTVVAAIAVGVGVTVVSAIGPALRAVRIPPVAALVDNQEERGGSRSAPSDRRAASFAIGGVAALAWRG